MNHHNKATLLCLFTLFAIIGIAANIDEPSNYRNLKVLPKDIAPGRLDSIMSAYNKALKVNCDFCHVKPKKNIFSPVQPKGLDFALDNPMKEEARRMIRLQMDINTKYFNNDISNKGKRPEYLNVVSCNTCHRGNPYPAYE